MGASEGRRLSRVLDELSISAANIECPHIRWVEIGYQNTGKILEQCVKNVCFPRFVVDVHNLLHVCEHPDEPVTSLDAYLCFVGVEQWAAGKPFDQCVVGNLVLFAGFLLEVICCAEGLGAELSQ